MVCSCVKWYGHCLRRSERSVATESYILLCFWFAVQKSASVCGAGFAFVSHVTCLVARRNLHRSVEHFDMTTRHLLGLRATEWRDARKLPRWSCPLPGGTSREYPSGGWDLGPVPSKFEARMPPLGYDFRSNRKQGEDKQITWCRSIINTGRKLNTATVTSPWSNYVLCATRSW
jgi:hypothetical protein